MEQRRLMIRMPRLILVLIILLPAVLGGVHGVHVPAADGNEIVTNRTHISVARWTVRKGGGHGGHGGHGHGHGDAGNGRGREAPLVFTPRTIAGSTNGHHKGYAAPTHLGRLSTVATCVLILVVAAIPLLHI